MSNNGKGLSKREQKRLERQRKRRNERYRKQKEKQQKKQTKTSDKTESKLSVFAKYQKALDQFFSLFIPSKSRIAHNRLLKQGVLFTTCAIMMAGGFFLAKKGYDHREYLLSQAQSFMSNAISFSKTQVKVSTKVSPFMTDNKKTLYIPLNISDTSNIDTDAGKYHVLVMPASGDELKSKITTAQLMSYGSTGHMVLIVNSANKLKSQLVQVLLWSGSKLTNDHYDASQDDDIRNQNQQAINELKSKYDMVSFTINLAGTTIPVIHHYQKVTASKKVKYYTGKGKHKKVRYKTVKYLKIVPDTYGQYLYGDNKRQYIYNRIYAHKAIDKLKKKVVKQYSLLDTNIGRIKRDYDSLKSAGYDIPKMPDWAGNKDNNLSNGLPLSYDSLLKVSLLNKNTFVNNPSNLNYLAQAYIKYTKDQNSANDDSDDADNQNDNTQAANSSDITDLHIKEAKQLSQIMNKVLRNKITKQTLGNGDTDNSSDSNTSKNVQNDQKMWEDYQQCLTNVLVIKYKIYYTIPMQMWGKYKIFLNDTSSGSKFRANANIGRITYSKTSGYNDHGRFMTILGLTSSK